MNLLQQAFTVEVDFMIWIRQLILFVITIIPSIQYITAVQIFKL